MPLLAVAGWVVPDHDMTATHIALLRNLPLPPDRLSCVGGADPPGDDEPSNALPHEADALARNGASRPLQRLLQRKPAASLPSSQASDALVLKGLVAGRPTEDILSNLARSQPWELAEREVQWGKVVGPWPPA